MGQGLFTREVEVKEARKTLPCIAQMINDCAGVMKREAVFNVYQDFLQYS